MQALLLLLALALPARAGVAASAEAGAEGSVPRISLQTSLSPMSGPSLSATMTPGLNASFAAPSAPAPALAAPSALTPQALPAPLAISAVAGPQARPALPAASAPDAPNENPAAAAPVEKSAPSFKTKILGMLKSMANPFGGKNAEDLPPASEAERLDREFTRRDAWSDAAPAARAEIEGLRARKLSKEEMRNYVRAEAAAALERIKSARGVENIGFHYNLHGGRRQDYVGAGIHATMGDIALQYSMHGDRNHKVYHFQSELHQLYDLLNENHPQQLLFPSRMGTALNLFDLNAPALEAAKADGRIKNPGAISMDFHGMPGVPYSAYLTPPLEVFTGTAKKVGLRSLSREEETLATVRYIEAAATMGGEYIPGGKPAAPGATAKSAAARARAAAAAGPATRIIPQFKLVDNEFYYHGTTMEDLARVVESGGAMAADVSQFSLRARDSAEYAADRRRRLGRDENPEVLLQFPREALAPFVSGAAFSAALAATDRGMPPIHAAYAAATKPVPLSLMTDASKATLLSWLRARNDPRLARFTQLLD